MKLRSSINFGLLFFFLTTILGRDLGGGGGNRRGIRRGIIILVISQVIDALVVNVIMVGGDEHRRTVIQGLDASRYQIIDMESAHFGREGVLNCGPHPNRGCTLRRVPVLLPRGSMSRLLPLDRWSLVLGDPKQSTEQICDRRFVGAHGRGVCGLCDINSSMGDLMGGGNLAIGVGGAARPWW